MIQLGPGASTCAVEELGILFLWCRLQVNLDYSKLHKWASSMHSIASDCHSSKAMCDTTYLLVLIILAQHAQGCLKLTGSGLHFQDQLRRFFRQDTFAICVVICGWHLVVSCCADYGASRSIRIHSQVRALRTQFQGNNDYPCRVWNVVSLMLNCAARCQYCRP